MDGWRDLEAELALWRQAGATPSFWWRADDAGAPSRALETLIALSERRRAPLHLAVAPAAVTKALSDALRGARDVHALQHGFAHVNHEPPGARASEVGRNRPLAAQLADLREGWRRLRAAGLPNLLPALAPPWNRIAPETVAHLPRLGYRLLSTAGPRPTPTSAPGLAQVNIHYDPILWREGPRFRGVDRTLASLVRHLAERRTGQVDRDEPTGLMTHHLDTDGEAWAFLDTLLERLAHREAGVWVRLVEITGEA